MKDVYYRVYALFFVYIFFPFFIEAICHQPSSLETHVPFCRRNRRYKNKIITNMMTMNTNKRKYIAAPIPMQSNCVWIMIQLVTNVNVYEFFFCWISALSCCCRRCYQSMHSIFLYVWVCMWNVLSLFMKNSLEVSCEWMNEPS